METIRRDFISNISYELRTPLAGIKALIQTLGDGALEDPPAAQCFLDRMDAEVDALYNRVYRESITYILEDPKCIEQANYLLWAAHNLERAADRVTNICERIKPGVFVLVGRSVGALDSARQSTTVPV
ncbi:MAG: hypothetical protein ISS56_06585 [Anaerolineae bacterium]|nr:hypothetical protein [Anaerolineae bacterium]